MSVFKYSVLGCIAVRVAWDFISISITLNERSIAAISMETLSRNTLVKILSARDV